MSAFWDNWATAHRNWRAIFAVVGLGGILIWSQLSSGEFIRRDRVMATVVAVETTGMGEKVKFELPDGKHTFLIIDQAVPKVGDKRPIFIDVYDNGKNYVSYDHMDWKLNY